MPANSFPERIRALEPFSDRFQAYRLAARDCDVLFASYPAGTAIEPHIHDTENWGVITKGQLRITVDGREMSYGPGEWYHVPARVLHSARFSVDTEEIEFWFRP